MMSELKCWHGDNLPKDAKGDSRDYICANYSNLCQWFRTFYSLGITYLCDVKGLKLFTVELGVLVPYPEEGKDAKDQRRPSALQRTQILSIKKRIKCRSY